MCKGEPSSKYQHFCCVNKKWIAVVATMSVFVVLVMIGITRGQVSAGHSKVFQPPAAETTTTSVPVSLEEAWYQQEKYGKDNIRCEPQLQYVIVEDKHGLASPVHKIPVKLCPRRTCGVCKRTTERCLPKDTEIVTKIALYKKHVDDYEAKEYRQIFVKEETRCECERDAASSFADEKLCIIRPQDTVEADTA